MTIEIKVEVDAKTRAEFQQLAAEWQQSRRFMSSLTAMVALSPYQKIIEMGDPAVPLLLAELEREPDHWFAALSAITGADPVAVEDRGRMDRMFEAWLSWGRAQGYSW